MRPRRSLLLGLGIAGAILGVAAALLLRGDGTGRQPVQSPATLPDPAPDAFLRPLAHEIDARFRGRLILPSVAGTLLGAGPGEPAAVAALEAAWEQAAAADPADIGAYLDLHRRLLWLGWWNRAEAAAGVVLGAVPDHPPALALLSAVRFEQGRRSEGMALARRALDAAPDLVLGLVGEASATAAKGGFERARSSLERAVRLEPDAPQAAFLLGNLLSLRNDFGEAVPWLRRAGAYLPDPAAGRGAFIETMTTLARLLEGRRAHRVPPGFRGVAVRLEHGPLWAVAVSLQGQGARLEGLMVVDSGASMTMVGPEAAKVVRMDGSVAPHTVGVAGAFASSPAVVERLVLGDLTLEDVPVLIDRGREQPLGPDVIGSLGVSLLREFLVTLDLRQGTLRLDPSGTAPDPSRVDVPFELLHNQPLVRARLGQGPERQWLFDTGADALFLSPAVAQADLGIGPGDRRAQRRTMVAIGGQEVETLGVPSEVPLMLGGEALPVVQTVIDPGVEQRNSAARSELAGTIGLFLRARFTLDFARQRLGIEP